jgi:lysophospholipase L1-like esterase
MPRIQLNQSQNIVFIGDSITDADRREPAIGPLGWGYVHFIANILMAKNPEKNFNIINTGIAGNTSRDIKRRWNKDCLAHKPNILSLQAGINDIWRCFEPGQLPHAVTVEEYESNLRDMLSAIDAETTNSVILIEPFMFYDGKGDDDVINSMYKELPSYIKAMNNVAGQVGAAVVNLQKKIDAIMPEAPPEKWSEDTVHPYQWAHAWIADQWFKTTGL